MSRSTVVRSVWALLGALLVPLAPALASSEDVRAEVRQAADSLPHSIALRRGEAIRLGVDELFVEGAADEVVSVEYGGMLLAVAEGVTTIRPVRDGVRGDPIRVQVSESPVSTMRVDGAPVYMELGDNVRMRAVAYRLDFSVDDVTDSAVWTSSDPSVLRVDEAGRVVGMAPGLAVIDAWTDGRVGRSGVIRVE